MMKAVRETFKFSRQKISPGFRVFFGWADNQPAKTLLNSFFRVIKPEY
jgi:hypothetical protein